MTDSAELEKRLREYADSIKMAREHQYKHMGFSAEGEQVFREAAAAILSLHDTLTHIYELAEQGEWEPVPSAYLRNIRERALEALRLSTADGESGSGQ